MITAGASLFPHDRLVRMGQIARPAVRLYLFVDMAHIAGLVAGGQHPNPVPAHFVSSTTHKSSRGPRGGFCTYKEEYAKKLDAAVFPGMQGGPLMHVIAAKAACFGEALNPNSRTMCPGRETPGPWRPKWRNSVAGVVPTAWTTTYSWWTSATRASTGRTRRQPWTAWASPQQECHPVYHGFPTKPSGIRTAYACCDQHQH